MLVAPPPLLTRAFNAMEKGFARLSQGFEVGGHPVSLSVHSRHGGLVDGTLLPDARDHYHLDGLGVSDGPLHVLFCVERWAVETLAVCVTPALRDHEEEVYRRASSVCVPTWLCRVPDKRYRSIR